jgi:hypothetical protein
MNRSTKWFLSIFFLFLISILLYPTIKDKKIKLLEKNSTLLITDSLKNDTLDLKCFIDEFIDNYYHDADSLLKLKDTINIETYNDFISVINKFNKHIDSVQNKLNIKNDRIIIYNKYKNSIDSIFKNNIPINNIKKYNIIIGSFEIKENAEKFIQKYDNNPNLTIIKKNNLYNVSIMSFSTLNEAKNNLTWLKVNSIHKNCWILKL